MNYKNKTITLIAIATIVRCITAASVGLGNDEVYYRLYAQHLHWNYFDHPPMVGWLIRFTTANLLLDTPFFIRLGAIASAAITTWIFFLTGRKMLNEQTGFLAAAFYTSTIYGSIIAGTFILPDSPQMMCWAAGLYLLTDVVAYNQINPKNNIRVLCFGIVCGIGMLCKIHTSFLWLGFLLYILVYNRSWLKEPALYGAAAITLLFFYPVIQWNIDHHFITYLYHSKRVNIASGGMDFNGFFTFAAGQLFYFNPVTFILLLSATAAACRNKIPVLLSQKRILLLCGLPLIAMATVISLFKNVLPHWTGPAYSSLILLAACQFSAIIKKGEAKKRFLPIPLYFALGFLALLITIGIFLTDGRAGTMGKKEHGQLGKGDFTLDMYGWTDLKTSFKQILEADLNNGRMKKNAAIVCNKWFPASHIDYYVAMPLNKDMIGLGEINDIHQYAFINTERKWLQPGDDAYCIVPSNYDADVKAIYGHYFKTILSPEIVPQYRNGVLCRYFYVWRLKDFIGSPLAYNGMLLYEPQPLKKPGL